MAQTPIVFVPGLLCSAEIFGPQIAALWPYGPVHVASTLEGSTIAEIASSILAAAPPSFALVGLSMGGDPRSNLTFPIGPFPAGVDAYAVLDGVAAALRDAPPPEFSADRYANPITLVPFFAASS